MLSVMFLAVMLVLNVWSLRRLSASLARRRVQPVKPAPAAIAPAVSTTGGDTRSHAPEDAGAEVCRRVLPLEGILPDADGAGALARRLQALPGVLRAYVSSVTALTYLDYRPDMVSETQLVATISDAGYRVANRSHWFNQQR